MDLKIEEKRMDKERTIIHLVIIYTPSYIQNVYSFADYEDATDFFIAKAKEMYEDIPECESVDDVYEYVSSEEFMDEGFDTFIAIEDSIVQEKGESDE